MTEVSIGADIAAVVKRLGAIAALKGRIETAAELTATVAAGALPNITPHAYVVPLGLRPIGSGEASAGAFTQDVDQVVGVILCVRYSGDAKGGKALPAIDQLIAATIGCLAGWAPEGAIGVFRLMRGQLVSVNAGMTLYQLDFAIQDQLRIFE